MIWLALLASSAHGAVVVVPRPHVVLTPVPAAAAPAAALAAAPPAPPAFAGPSPSAIPLDAPAPLALRAAPLLAASADPGVPVEAAAAAGERLTALLQGARDPLKRVVADEVVPGVIHLRFPTQRLLASTFVRFQEHYESPKFRGRVFSLAEFKAWYKTTKRHGRFTYYDDWDGFNIPSRVLRRFKEGDFDPLSARERALLARVAEREGRFYVIGTAGGDADKAVLRHEVAHGLWYTRPDYRRRARAILKELDLGPVRAMLRGLGYHRSVWEDEAHAWIGDGDAALKEAGLADPRPYREARRRLRALQNEYVSGLF